MKELDSEELIEQIEMWIGDRLGRLSKEEELARWQIYELIEKGRER